MKSILQDYDERRCFLSGRTDWLEEHHVFGGANRWLSEKYGLKVKLNHYWHNEPPIGVHHNKGNDRYLKRLAQKAFEQEYPDLDFVKIFGKNYL